MGSVAARSCSSLSNEGSNSASEAQNDKPVAVQVVGSEAADANVNGNALSTNALKPTDSVLTTSDSDKQGAVEEERPNLKKASSADTATESVVTLRIEVDEVHDSTDTDTKEKEKLGEVTKAATPVQSSKPAPLSRRGSEGAEHGKLKLKSPNEIPAIPAFRGSQRKSISGSIDFNAIQRVTTMPVPQHMPRTTTMPIKVDGQQEKITPGTGPAFFADDLSMKRKNSLNRTRTVPANKSAHNLFSKANPLQTSKFKKLDDQKFVRRLKHQDTLHRISKSKKKVWNPAAVGGITEGDESIQRSMSLIMPGTLALLEEAPQSISPPHGTGSESPLALATTSISLSQPNIDHRMSVIKKHHDHQLKRVRAAFKEMFENFEQSEHKYKYAEVAHLLKEAAVIVIKLQEVLSQRNPTFKHVRLGSNAILFLENQNEIGDEEQFVRRLVHATYLTEDNYYLEHLTMQEVDDFIDQEFDPAVLSDPHRRVSSLGNFNFDDIPTPGSNDGSRSPTGSIKDNQQERRASEEKSMSSMNLVIEPVDVATDHTTLLHALDNTEEVLEEDADEEGTSSSSDEDGAADNNNLLVPEGIEEIDEERLKEVGSFVLNEAPISPKPTYQPAVKGEEEEEAPSNSVDEEQPGT